MDLVPQAVKVGSAPHGFVATAGPDASQAHRVLRPRNWIGFGSERPSGARSCPSVRSVGTGRGWTWVPERWRQSPPPRHKGSPKGRGNRCFSRKPGRRPSGTRVPIAAPRAPPSRTRGPWPHTGPRSSRPNGSPTAPSAGGTFSPAGPPDGVQCPRRVRRLAWQMKGSAGGAAAPEIRVNRHLRCPPAATAWSARVGPRSGWRGRVWRAWERAPRSARRRRRRPRSGTSRRPSVGHSWPTGGRTTGPSWGVLRGRRAGHRRPARGVRRVLVGHGGEPR
jgi:hypothetical protein